MLPVAHTASVMLVAHQGGWDEILLVAGPILVIVGLLSVVKRRVERGMTASLEEYEDRQDREDDLSGPGR